MRGRGVMPKIVTDYEREQTKKALIKYTHQLIVERKGIKTITVDDMIRSAGIGKSTFYSIYKSKEMCFYDVLEHSLIDGMKKATMLRQEKMTSEERTIRFLREVYLAKDSLTNYFSPTDIEILFRKLPPEYSEKEHLLSGGGIMDYVAGELGYDEAQAQALDLLLGCVDQVATNYSASDCAREEALNYLIQMLVDFFRKNKRDTK